MNHHSYRPINPPTHPPTHPQKVLIYNVWIAPLVRWNPSENLDAICAFVHGTGADVVCMQEVSSRVTRVGWNEPPAHPPTYLSTYLPTHPPTHLGFRLAPRTTRPAV